MEQRTSTAFSASEKPTENTPAAGAVYPQVYPLEIHTRQNPVETGTSPLGSNGAGAPDTDGKAPDRKTRGFFVGVD